MTEQMNKLVYMAVSRLWHKHCYLTWGDCEPDMHSMILCTRQLRLVCASLISNVHAATQICNAEGTCHVLIIDYSINILAVLGCKWKPTDKYFSESMQTKFASYMQSIH